MLIPEPPDDRRLQYVPTGTPSPFLSATTTTTDAADTTRPNHNRKYNQHKTNDNNVKIIVLDKILSLRKMYAKVLEDYITDILNIIKDETVVSLEIN